MNFLRGASFSILVAVIAPFATFVLAPQPASTFERVEEFETRGVILESVDYDDRPAVSVEYESRGFRDWLGIAKSMIGLDSDPPNPIARIAGSEFSNGTIEVDLSSSIAASVLGMARGFAGIAFRVSDDMEKYEVVYLRPANGRVDNEDRRSHALQYSSHPNFHFDASRRESPGQYETSADIGLNEWVKLRIEVEGENADIFVNGEYALTVDDLKLGADGSGGIALWVGIGTKAYFSNLTISQSPNLSD